MKKILCVCSSGGHLDQMLAILPAPAGTKVVFATFMKPDAIRKISEYKSYALKWPTNRSVWKALQNAIIAFRVILIEKPDLIISTGAAPAVPFFYVGKLAGTRNIFIECIDRVDMATLTAKLVKPVTDLFVCQWDSQLPDYPRRVQIGRSR